MSRDEAFKHEQSAWSNVTQLKKERDKIESKYGKNKNFVKDGKIVDTRWKSKQSEYLSAIGKAEAARSGYLKLVKK